MKFLLKNNFWLKLIGAPAFLTAVVLYPRDESAASVVGHICLAIGMLSYAVTLKKWVDQALFIKEQVLIKTLTRVEEAMDNLKKRTQEEIIRIEELKQKREEYLNSIK